MEEGGMECNDLEREGGIRIVGKNRGIDYKGRGMNILDRPGHGDFGGEVE
ncbi:GTP-binding protein, partial [Staphylococcus epidermidis]